MDKKRILRIGAIVAVAGATGFVMQAQQKTPTPRIAAASGLPAPNLAPLATMAPATADSVVTAVTPVVAETLTSPAPSVAPMDRALNTTGIAPQTAPVVALVGPSASELADTTASGTSPTPDVASVAAAPPACPQDMALIARAGAMLDIGLLAPCRPDQRVLIRHGGLVVTARTSAAGTLVASLPALQSPAEVSIAFADGASVTERATVADLARFDRFAVQWMAGDSFQLHAYTAAGAAAGVKAGHVWADAPGFATPDGAFLTQIGDAGAERPLLAEVFTWPAGTRATDPTVTLNIEAAVTDETCGREILGETIQLNAGRLTTRDLSIEMPGCDAVGEYVVLPNPVATEKLAAN